MKKVDTIQDAESIGVFDLNMAEAYYACVFDAEIDEGSIEGETRKMRIGGRNYHLIHDRKAVIDETAHCAVVEDVDLSVARVVTRGGKIIRHPDTAADGHREGQVKDPFGHLWLVSSR